VVNGAKALPIDAYQGEGDLFGDSVADGVGVSQAFLLDDLDRLLGNGFRIKLVPPGSVWHVEEGPLSYLLSETSLTIQYGPL
jgi:hypothetical protein